MGDMIERPEIFSDQILGFTLPERSARGRLVRLDDVVGQILSAHDYPAPVTHLLAEALVLASLMGSLLKGDSAQMTLQAQTEDGPVSLLVCDYRDGEIRGYAEYDDERFAELGVNPSLATIFGKGYLAITFETGGGKRYQGIVPLEGASLAEACQNYFQQSEQVPTIIRVGVSFDGRRCLAGGLLVQHLADGEEGRERLHVRTDHPDWEHVAALTSTISHEELIDSELSLDAITWRLFHEEPIIKVQTGPSLSRGCRCSAEYYEQVIARFPEGEKDAMRNDDGEIIVDCAFCSKKFTLLK
ncbi:MAG: Hsp33 family molecular chaperone HslO [Erythrobacter sp.]